MSRSRSAAFPPGYSTGRHSRPMRTTSARRATLRRRIGRDRISGGGGLRPPALAPLVLELLPQRDDLRGIEDRGVRARDDPDEQREREVADRVAAEEEEREQRHEHRERRDHGPRQRLHDREVDDGVERLAHVQLQVLADPVEDDDRVVHGEADDGEHGGHEEAVDLDPEEVSEDREEAEHEEGVVEERDDGRDPVAERGAPPERAERERDEQHDEDRREYDG